jgi:hypothetical protein
MYIVVFNSFRGTIRKIPRYHRITTAVRYSRNVGAEKWRIQSTINQYTNKNVNIVVGNSSDKNFKILNSHKRVDTYA